MVVVEPASAIELHLALLLAAGLQHVAASTRPHVAPAHLVVVAVSISENWYADISVQMVPILAVLHKAFWTQHFPLSTRAHAAPAHLVA